LVPPWGRDDCAACDAVAGGGASIFGANPFQRRCHFLLAGERNALAFAILDATAAAWDAVKRARHNRLARGRVPIENIGGAKVKTLEIEEALLAFEGRKPGKTLSLTARHCLLIRS
jgi:hypothetical protein